MNTYRNLVQKLRAANLTFKAINENGFIYIETDSTQAVVDALGFDSFMGYIDGVEVIVG